MHPASATFILIQWGTVTLGQVQWRQLVRSWQVKPARCRAVEQTLATGRLQEATGAAGQPGQRTSSANLLHQAAIHQAAGNQLGQATGTGHWKQATMAWQGWWVSEVQQHAGGSHCVSSSGAQRKGMWLGWNEAVACGTFVVWRSDMGSASKRSRAGCGKATAAVVQGSTMQRWQGNGRVNCRKAETPPGSL